MKRCKSDRDASLVFSKEPLSKLERLFWSEIDFLK